MRVGILCHLTLLTSLFMLAMNLSASPIGSDGPDQRANGSIPPLTSIRARIAAMVSTRDDFPEEPVSSVTLTAPRFSAERGGRFLAPATIRFQGIDGGTCRLVTLSRKQFEPALVDLPSDANPENCRGFRTVHYLDINDDGLLDIAASITVWSLAINGYLDEQVVYLSAPDRSSGYCYSEQASRNLAPKDMISVKTVALSLSRERRRLNIHQFGCVMAACADR